MTEPVIGKCGKRVYQSKKVGLKLARRVNDSGRENVQPYHCTLCHGWHLGTLRKDSRAKDKRRIVEVV